MTRSTVRKAVFLFTLAWAAIIYSLMAWNVRSLERAADERMAAIEAQMSETAVAEATYAEPAEADKPPYLGEFRISVYTPECDGGVWGYQTATGVTSEHLATCAVDPNTIPLGSVLYVGDLMVKAVDTGSAVQGNTIDIFYDASPAEAREWLAGFGDTASVWVSMEAQT